EDEHDVQQVGQLTDRSLPPLGLRGERGFYGLLDELFRDRGSSLAKKLCRERTLRKIAPALPQHTGELRQKAREGLVVRRRKACRRAGVAHRSRRVRLDEERVGVAVEGQLHQLQRVAGGLAFLP